MPFDEIYNNKNEITVIIPFNLIQNFLFFIKKHEILKFDYLVEICGVDYPERKKRFEIIYIVSTKLYNQRIKVKIYTKENQTINSISNIFINSNWLERELWDMFGIFIQNHPDLRKILTDYGFNHFPLRKDFPITGFNDLKYSDFDKMIIKTKIEFSQERVLNFYKYGKNTFYLLNTLGFEPKTYRLKVYRSTY